MPKEMINLSYENNSKINILDVHALDDEEKKDAFVSSIQNIYKSFEIIKGSPLDQVERLISCVYEECKRGNQMTLKDVCKEVIS